MEPKPNRLIHEKSPYLLQHAYNPVDWYPWGQEAFEKARREDKPVFLSIGYSTCHWCHVMEHESFEDPEVASLLNRTFVCIKVDREERPDIDNVYMTACQTMGGSGGWPLTLILTPEGKPFMAGTYFPKEGRFGQMGMMELVPRVHESWTQRREEVLAAAEQVASALKEGTRSPRGEEPGETTLRAARDQLERRFDLEHGGFGNAPKFPTPHNLVFLLRWWKRTGDEQDLGMVEKTLQEMRRGGIYDQIGYGFHRYSTDARWIVPHFEKMLYDQALLVLAYTEAYQATGRDEYRDTAEEVLGYVLRDMTAPEGGFYSAEDADSEGEEGKFYLWTTQEVRQALKDEEAELFQNVFHAAPEGNFPDPHTGVRTGGNILHQDRPLSDWGEKLKVPEDVLHKRLKAAREKLFVLREKRVHPGKDDKVLVDWNGLMIAALARAAWAFNEPRYIKVAERAVDFIVNRMRTLEGRLLHRFRDGEAAIPALADDYAFLIWGLIELYQATFEPRHLRVAIDLNKEFITHFWDEKDGGFFFTADDGERLIARQKELYDGALPSGNSAALLNLLRLARLTGDSGFEAKAGQMARTFSSQVASSPPAFTMFLTGIDFALGPSREIVIAGNPEAKDTQDMLAALRKHYLAREVILLRPTGQSETELVQLAQFTKVFTGLDGRATAYVCENHACQLPTTDIRKMLQLLA